MTVSFPEYENEQQSGHMGKRPQPEREDRAAGQEPLEGQAWILWWAVLHEKSAHPLATGNVHNVFQNNHLAQQHVKLKTSVMLEMQQFKEKNE